MGNFFNNFVYGFNHKDSAFVSTVLNYRFRYMFRTDLEYTIKKVAIGVTINYYSFMENIDYVFADFGIPPGLQDFRYEHVNGDWILMHEWVMISIRIFVCKLWLRIFLIENMHCGLQKQINLRIIRYYLNILSNGKRVTGIGGIFFKAKSDNKKLQEWYSKHLGLKMIR